MILTKVIKKYKCIKLITLLLFLISNIFILTSCNSENKKTDTNQNENKQPQNISYDNNPSQEQNDENKQSDENKDNNEQDNQKQESIPQETTISEFSTKILTKSKNRANNIKITCEKINGMEVKSGEEFSFCGRTGTSKESEGYKKADVIVGDDTIKALGGGNCQVSTTLYNAVLKSSELEVTERHPHGKKVNYVPEGKDADIAHGSKDFKFKNNSDKTLKIYASSDGKTVNIKLALLS